MKKEELFNIIGEVDEQKVAAAGMAMNTKKKSRPVWVKWGAMAACLCLVVVGILVPTMNNQISGPNNIPQQSGTHLENPNNVDKTDPHPSTPNVNASIQISLANIYLNEFDPQIAGAPKYYDPTLYDSVLWSEKEVYAYYGKDISPKYIPDGLLYSLGQRVVVSKTGEVCADTVVLQYYHEFDETGAPKHTEKVSANYGFSVIVSKLGLLSDCLYILPDNEVKQTDIGGTEVTFGYRAMPYVSVTNEGNSHYDLYVAEFEIGEIAYQIVAEQMSKEDVVKIVSSIIYDTADIEITQ